MEINFGRQINGIIQVIYQVRNEVLFIDYESIVRDRVLHVY